MWKQNSQRLTAELDKLRSELQAETKHRTSLQMEVLEVHTQCNELQREFDKLKLQMEELREKQEAKGNILFQMEDKDNIEKEWEREMKVQKDLNDNLALELKRSQEPNLELVSKQQMEIDEMDTYSISSEDNKRTSLEDQDFHEETRKEIHGSCVEETVVRLREAPEENGSKALKLHLQQLQEFHKNQEIIPLGMKTLRGENSENCSPFKEIEVLRKKLQVLEQDHKELKEENMDLQFKLEESRRDIQACRNSTSPFLMADLNAVIKISELFSELYECYRISLTNERKQMDSSSLMGTLDYKSNFMEGCGNGGFHVGEQVEVMFNKFIKLKDLFEASFTLHEEGCGLYQGVKCLHMESRFDDTGLETNTIIGSLRHENMLKDKEIEGLKQCKKELEALIAQIEEEKSRTEVDVTGSLGKSSVDSICKTSLKLTSENDELEVHLLELENENICLSERISGLEAVLRHLTDEKELISLLLQDSQSDVGKLQNKVCELGNEIMTQKLDFKGKLQDRQQQFFEALEEIQSLKTEKEKLQAMVESIMEEHSLLKISNNELRKQKMDLQEHCAILEVEMRDTLELFSGILNEVENLEASFCRMVKEVSSKEKSMNEELDALAREIHKHNANVARDDSLLNQMYLEKTAEVENLERRVAHLMRQISTTFDETETEIVLELSCLREDKAMLEAALQEAQGKLRLYESKIGLIHKEAERKVKGAMNELEVSKQNQEILMDCHRKALSSLETVKNSESKSKNILRRHEFKLKSCESDRQNLAEQVSALKIRLQDEVLALKKSLIESEHQNKCLKASFEMLSEDYEKLKGRNVIYLEEISDMQKVATELGDYKRSKTALEEKVWRLEWELTAKEASCTLQSKMKNELARLRRTNSQLKGRMRYLEEEKEAFSKRIQVLEEKLKQNNEEIHKN